MSEPNAEQNDEPNVVETGAEDDAPAQGEQTPGDAPGENDAPGDYTDSTEAEATDPGFDTGTATPASPEAAQDAADTSDENDE